MSDFDNYFNDEVEYPRDIAINILPVGTRWDYVGSNFLNAFINYVNVEKAYVLNRYLKWQDNPQHEISIQDPPSSFKWVSRKPTTKLELFELLTQPGRVHHVKLDCDFQDDVLILATAKSDEEQEQKLWFFFWYDRDCSDCSLGRFTTSDSDEVVKEKFSAYCTDAEHDRQDSKEIPLHYFRGWIEG